MSFDPEIVIDLKAKTVTLKNMQLITATCETSEDLSEYIARLIKKDKSIKFSVDGLKVSFFLDLPVTSFFDFVFDAANIFPNEEMQLDFARYLVSEALKDGLYEKIIDIAKKEFYESERQ